VGFKAESKLSFKHPYPPTKLMFIPDREGSRPDLLATTGDYLRIWQIGDEGVTLSATLNNNKASEFCAPLTSFDWNAAEPKRLATSSIDTTCTIWDIEKGVVDTQLIAHDREVYDIAWGGVGVFASVSADGSVRVFDLRDKEHSTIIYEAPQADTPLLRLGWNKQDPRCVRAWRAARAHPVRVSVLGASLFGRSPQSPPSAQLHGHDLDRQRQGDRPGHPLPHRAGG